MSDTLRCWLVDRSVDDGRVVTVTYATTDGAMATSRQQALVGLDEGVPAAVEVHREDLTAVEDQATRDRYETEATRMRSQFDADARV